MNKEYFKKQFIKFLKDNNVYGLYILNFRNRSHSTTPFFKRQINIFKDFIEDEKPETFFIHSFKWEQTPEGFEFWCDIDDLWLELLRK